MQIIKPTTTQFKFSESDHESLTDTVIMLTHMLDNMDEDDILFGYTYDDLQSIVHSINIIDCDIIRSLKYNNGLVICGRN